MTIQSVHLQPRYWVTKPPMIGPKTACSSAINECIALCQHIFIPGPFSGPRLQTEKANALCSSSTMSANVPGALAIIALPANAPINRTTRSSATDVASAAGIIRTSIRNMQMTDIGFRPYVSLRGAMITEPTARPIK